MTSKTILILYLIITSVAFSAQADILLNQPWEFNQDGEEIWYPATVPGVVHLDLLNNKLIDDPYWENNEIKLQWIENKNWNYRTSFFVGDQLNSENIEIECDGLDTYADVFINGKLVISANNMFRKWIADIKSFIKSGKNELLIKFKSPISVNKNKHDNHPYTLPSGCETVETKVGAYTRKAAYHFGWDWGPRFVTAGIWRPIRIKTWKEARITDVHCTTESISNNKAEIMVDVTIETGLRRSKIYCLQYFSFDKEKQWNKLKNQYIVLKPGINHIKYKFDVKNPRLWWTNGLGDAHLNSLKLSLKSIGGFKEYSGKTIRYGIRTIELVNEKDSIGTSFYFKLNGKPLFMKGANYIPQDMFLPRVTETSYQNLIQDVKSANMNMIRVWGGGIYENDIFYELCDENGILVWQDFMFAGSLYPTDDDFIENVKAEVKDNILRLRNHPCIALWCGNNEIEVAWHNWGWHKQHGITGQDSVQAWQGYQNLFHQIIPSIVKQYDGNRSYTSTSPLSNWGKIENFNHSSMHYWGVWHGRDHFKSFDKFVGRFMVEYGFQSFPSIETIKRFAADTSFYLESEVMKNRQKSYIGNGLITTHIEHYFDLPTTFEEFVMLSQKTQAKALEQAINAHLSRQPHCMGTLFWQLNDCWPGPSWSIIDYYGNHKLAYNSVKELFKQKN